MTFIFLHAFYLKFTINATFEYIPVDATFSRSTVYLNHYCQYFNENGISLSLLYADFDPITAVLPQLFVNFSPSPRHYHGSDYHVIL